MNGTFVSSNVPQISPVGPDLSSSRQPLTHVCASRSCVTSQRPTNKVSLWDRGRSWYLPQGGSCWHFQALNSKRTPWWLFNLFFGPWRSMLMCASSPLASNGDGDGGLMNFDAYYLLNLSSFLFSGSSGQTSSSPCCTHNYDVAQFDS